MFKRCFISIPVAALLAGGCNFQSKSTSLLPTAPSDVAAAVSGAGGAGASSAPGASGTGSAGAPAPSSSTSGSPSAGGFTGTWASTTLPGLPNISSCTDLNWEITSQTSSSVAGVVSAVCGSVADITATLTGEMQSDDLVNLTARGSAVAFGTITCPFDLTGTGRRESADAWRLDYRGTTCLGPVNGSEMLRRPSAASPAPAPEPEPAPSPSPSPSPAPAPAPSPKAGVACAGNTGKQIVDCVERAYPSLLAAHVSLQTRTANMQFLRDKIIETAKCKGMDVGLNLKRGGPSISTDFVTWRHDGILEGVDVGAGYDDTSKALDLMWYTYGPPNYGFPYYKDYGAVQCS